MIARLLIAASLLGAAAAPACAFGPTATSGNVRIPRMRGMLDWRPDGSRALYIRADTGRWYHATLENDCPRLANRSNIRFVAAPNGDFDAYSAVVADGWRCQVASITASAAPPPEHRRYR